MSSGISFMSDRMKFGVYVLSSNQLTTSGQENINCRGNSFHVFPLPRSKASIAAARQKFEMALAQCVLAQLLSPARTSSERSRTQANQRPQNALTLSASV